ncbi:hypothetical protein SAMN05421761_11687 [Belliella pelovolcani]|uniref:Helix-turn-helix domain-containing protein n=1 Tax=Belliella pelovolcani TaxID=529505 RepID=A0A1N7PIM2_9BACT|nr:hypothetical protein SAMN05421761_11687 [Belliella pelovolcani]
MKTPQPLPKEIFLIFQKVIAEPSFYPSHLSICMALINEFIKSGENPCFRITRRRVMKLSQIKSLSTYHKCIKELVNKKVIIYRSSFHPKLGSEVQFIF